MSLLTLLILVSTAVLITTLLPVKWRETAVLIGSVIALYWLQPYAPIRFSGFVLPTVVILLTVLGWWVTLPRGDEPQRCKERGVFVNNSSAPSAPPQFKKEDRTTLLIIVGLVIAISCLRFIPQTIRPLANRPPNPLFVAMALLGLGTAVATVARFCKSRRDDLQNRPIKWTILFIITLFLILKTEWLATAVSHFWRALSHQDTTIASAADLTWLGFSYIAFRLIHTLRERQTGQLPALSLREYASYILFFPAIIAGPIDRAERFAPDFRALPQMIGLDASRLADGLTRIGMGLFKKFVIADSLALGMSLDGVNITQIQSTGGLWLLLYGYAFRLYFDFGGYSDIAIGLGILLGIKLPENFRRPYRQTSLTAFWQSWHITLSDWARFYIFSPLSRALLRRKPRPSTTLIVLAAQLATMAAIGLWHGVSLNFFIWGLWHGIGLFIHKQWSDRTRKWYRGLAEKPGQKWAWTAVAWFITFHYVVISWVWFVMPTPAQAIQTIAKLFEGG